MSRYMTPEELDSQSFDSTRAICLNMTATALDIQVHEVIDALNAGDAFVIGIFKENVTNCLKSLKNTMYDEFSLHAG